MNSLMQFSFNAHINHYHYMKKYIFSALALLSIMVQSNASTLEKDSIGMGGSTSLITTESEFCSYKFDMGNSYGWSSNWFADFQFGTSILCGSPLGCGDAFDRMEPVFNAHIGKWFKPSVGFRFSGQGLKLKDSSFNPLNYKSLHVDLLYNVSSHFHDETVRLSHWNLIPYIGVGISFANVVPGNVADLEGAGGINHPFTIAYGVQLKYRVSQRLHASAEFGCLTTFASFDGYGSPSKLGDNLLSLSAGLSYTIGKVGWTSTKTTCRTCPTKKFRPIDRSRLNKSNEVAHHYAPNEYSGLNSLRARLKGLDRNHDTSISDSTTIDSVNVIGIPVYFFFKINTAEFVDDCQKINLDEIASIVKANKLTIHIVGAADSATGSPELNKELSMRRAKRIAKELKDRGVDIEHMKGFSYGGIDTFEPNEANRFTKVLLTRKR